MVHVMATFPKRVMITHSIVVVYFVTAAALT